MAAPKKPAKRAGKKAAPKKRAAAPATDANKTETKKPVHRWKPGESGNPNGRPKVVGEIRDLARLHTVTAMETLITVMTSAEAPPAARVAAAAHMLDRGYGKPTQNINAVVRQAQKMTDDELVAFLTGTNESHSGEGAAETSVH